MNCFNWILLVLGCMYGCMTLLVCFIQYKQKDVNLLVNILMTIGAIVVIVSVFLKINYNNIIYLIIGLLLIHAAAILNGITLYKKINPKHHLVRLIISLLIVGIYIIGMEV